MARLQQLKPQVASLPPRVAKATDSHGHSPVLEPLRHLYSTKAWRELRWATLKRDRFTCQRAECGAMLGHKTQLLVCDHREPHRGDLVLFWDPTNLQTLCKPCHDAAKQREERARR